MSGAIEQGVGPGQDGADGDLTVAVLVPHALHGQGVGGSMTPW